MKKASFFFFFLGRRIRESEKEKHCETIKNCTASTRKEVVVVVPGKARVSDARFFFFYDYDDDDDDDEEKDSLISTLRTIPSGGENQTRGVSN